MAKPTVNSQLLLGLSYASWSYSSPKAIALDNEVSALGLPLSLQVQALTSILGNARWVHGRMYDAVRLATGWPRWHLIACSRQRK